ncbi:MAG: flagellar filament capping protein FliD [Candidatus Melainabacteria bacterium]|nr:flagellar filament capping protein FliD [Candidatus Melainabacteria bacterium]
MGISLTGFASGLPVNDIIDQLMAIERRPLQALQEKKLTINLEQTNFTNIESRVSKLLSSLKKLTAQSVLDTNLFKAKAATSSKESLATASVTQNAAPQTIQLTVEKLATATTAKSLTGVGQLAAGTSAVSALANGTITSGNFTVFVDGVANTIAVNKDVDTVNDVLARITALDGVASASVNGSGVFSVTQDTGRVVVLGSSSDTSNFLNGSALSTGTKAGDVITGSRAIGVINTNAVLSDNTQARLQTAVTAGSTFKIGAATFDTTGKSLSTVIAEINNSSEAGVSASYNLLTNKLELTAKEKGSALLVLEDTTGNFLQATGLISGANTTAAQTAGQNAEFTINGSGIIKSSTNTVGEAITGLSGVTLNLVGASPGETVEIAVNRDTKALKDGIKDFVTKFNEVVSEIDKLTNAETGQIKNASVLKRFRNQLRQTITDMVSGLTDYNSAPLVGLSTGAVRTTASATPTLEFNESTFDAALADNATEVESLLVGTGGVLTQLQTLVDQAMKDDGDNTKDGLFASRRNLTSARIQDIDKSIEQTERRLEFKEKQLRQQFTLMEQLIAQFQSQGSSIAGLAKQISAGS